MPVWSPAAWMAALLLLLFPGAGQAASFVDAAERYVTVPDHVARGKDMVALLGVERQKQLLGCSDAASSCMAELAGALGADGLVTGQLARIGKSFQLNVKVLAADGSRTLDLLARYETRHERQYSRALARLEAWREHKGRSSVACRLGSEPEKVEISKQPEPTEACRLPRRSQANASGQT